MKKLAISLLMLPMITVAQQAPNTVDKPVVCVNVEVLMAELESSKYKEVPFWMGTDSKSYWGLVVNEKTGTWSLIQFDQEIGCIIGVGKNSGTIIQPKE